MTKVLAVPGHGVTITPIDFRGGQRHLARCSCGWAPTRRYASERAAVAAGVFHLEQERAAS